MVSYNERLVCITTGGITLSIYPDDDIEIEVSRKYGNDIITAYDLCALIALAQEYFEGKK